MTAGTAMIELDRVTKRYGALEAVSDASLAVTRGEFLAVLGPSGCGKTTMLRLIAGFEEPDAGTLAVDGRPVCGGGAWVPPERRQVGMVFQDYALFPHLSVADNVGYGLPRSRPGPLHRPARRALEQHRPAAARRHARRHRPHPAHRRRDRRARHARPGGGVLARGPHRGDG